MTRWKTGFLDLALSVGAFCAAVAIAEWYLASEADPRSAAQDPGRAGDLSEIVRVVGT